MLWNLWCLVCHWYDSGVLFRNDGAYYENSLLGLPLAPYEWKDATGQWSRLSIKEMRGNQWLNLCCFSRQQNMAMVLLIVAIPI